MAPLTPYKEKDNCNSNKIKLVDESRSSRG
jgi:hypothetical protein